MHSQSIRSSNSFNKRCCFPSCNMDIICIKGKKSFEFTFFQLLNISVKMAHRKKFYHIVVDFSLILYQ